MTAARLVLIAAASVAVVASVAAAFVTRPRPRTVLDVFYLAVPVIGVVVLVVFVAAHA
jgi:FtsH-binding integral membrane protein